MNRPTSRQNATNIHGLFRHAKEASYSLSGQFIALTMVLMACPAAQADLTSALSYQANWVRPKQQRIFTNRDDKIRAKLIVNRNIFDEGDPQTSGKLNILRNGKPAGSDRYVSKKGLSDIVNLTGPAIAAIGNEDENAVEIHQQCYQKITDFEYAYDDRTRRYERGTPAIDPGDIAAQHTYPIWGNSFSTVGNTRASLHWNQKLYEFGGTDTHLTIRKGRKTLYSAAVEPPDLPGTEKRKDNSPECFGPFVTTQIDPKGKVMTDLRVTRVVGSARLGCELIYYYDRPTHKMKVSTHEWGLNSPRLADLNGDSKIEFVTEDWSLSQPEMGGPIQIWRWGKGHKLIDVTRQFPQEIRKHSRAAYAQWKKDHTRATLLAHVGDLCLLNEKTAAMKALHSMNSDTETNDAITAQLKKAHYL